MLLITQARVERTVPDHPDDCEAVLDEGGSGARLAYPVCSVMTSSPAL